MDLIKYKINLKRNKKAELTMQAIFFIMMGLFMVWIIVFGVQKLMMVNDTISDQDRIQIKNDIKQALEYCNDPLNKGSFKSIPLKYKQFNMICFAGENPLDETNYGLFLKENINKTNGDNIYLIKAKFEYNQTSGNYSLINTDETAMIIDSFNIDIGSLSNSFCNMDEIKLVC